MVRTNTVILVAAMVLLACDNSADVGVGKTCQTACERGHTQCGDHDDCETICATMAQQAAATGCEAALATFIACVNNPTDICATGRCEPEIEAFRQCAKLK